VHSVVARQRIAHVPEAGTAGYDLVVGGWFERYRDGDRVQVWTEMTSAGAELRETDYRAIGYHPCRDVSMYRFATSKGAI
jgi:hypothetical protein